MVSPSAGQAHPGCRRECLSLFLSSIAPQAQEHGDRSSDHFPVLLFTLELSIDLENPKSPITSAKYPHKSNLVFDHANTGS